MARRPKTTSLEEVTYGDQTLRRGQGGETHQTAEDGYDVLTTQQGVPVADDQNSLKQGARSPTLIEDTHFREKIFTSTMSAFPNAWCMPAATARMVSSRPTNR